MGLSQNVTTTVIIANGAALSNGIFLGDKMLAAIIMPAAWTAASLTFQASPDKGTTWYDLHDDQGNEITIASPSASEYRQLDPSMFNSVECIKVRSGTSATPVNQGQQANVQLVMTKFFPVTV